MLKGYRKRFVLFNMLLVGVALLLALLVQGAYLFRNSSTELRNTMRMVIAPWDSMGGALRERKDAPPQREASDPSKQPEAEQPSDRADAVPPVPRGPDRGAERRDVITAFYTPSTDEVTLLASDAGSEEVLSAVREAAAQKDAFGALSGGAWIYYRETGSNNCKVALTDGAYLRDRLAGICLLLLAVYIGAMALVFLISVWLSKLAAKPMEDAMQMEQQFIADVSHDLKTPITVVLANSSILKSNPDADAYERAQWLESTESAATKMMTMVEQMLTLSALEAKGRKIEKIPVLLSSIAERIALELDSLAFERGVTVETEIAENVCVLATEEYAERICSSLLENAIKYEPDGGRVELSLSAERKKPTLTVRNCGSVISPEDLPHIFERFYRGDKARSAQGGHGLGLPILKQIVDLLGAQIRAESSPENGTVFTVVFVPGEG
ncbi:MAG: HAMP domain-containing sensor histidine kinase [Oscillospiraceae bacterium]|nr:HAMP domain-containing sensor histidine kinase [Oscillospiraceae bacterium]